MMPTLRVTALGLVASSMTVFGDSSIPTDAVSVGVRFSSDGKSLAILGEDRSVRLWDFATTRFVPGIEPRSDEVFVFLPASGDVCATIATNGAGRIHDTGGGRVLVQAELPVSTRFGGTMASTADGALLAIAGGDPKTSSGNLVQVLDRSGRSLFQVPAGIGGISAVAFSPDGTTLAATAYDADVRVWEARSGRALGVLEELKVAMFDTAFSPDGKYLATAGADQIIYLWETQSWKMSRRIMGQPETISVLRFSPDGTMLVTGGLNERNFKAPTQVILWDVASGRKVRKWTAEHAVMSLSFSPDGRQVAVADGTKSVKLFAVPRLRRTATH